MPVMTTKMLADNEARNLQRPDPEVLQESQIDSSALLVLFLNVSSALNPAFLSIFFAGTRRNQGVLVTVAFLPFSRFMLSLE